MADDLIERMVNAAMLAAHGRITYNEARACLAAALRACWGETQFHADARSREITAVVRDLADRLEKSE